MADSSVAENSKFEEEVRRAIALSIEADVADVTSEKRLQEDLGMDSLEGAELMMDLEERFDIGIPKGKGDIAATVGDVIVLVKECCNAKSGT